jgi:hypothetical protein
MVCAFGSVSRELRTASCVRAVAVNHPVLIRLRQARLAPYAQVAHRSPAWLVARLAKFPAPSNQLFKPKLRMQMLNLAVCPTAACSPISCAKVPFTKALWLAVLRRPVLGSVRWQANAQHPAAVAFATAAWLSKSAWPNSKASRPSPPMCFAIALSRATLKHFTGRCASGKISGNECSARPFTIGQKPKYMGRFSCSPRPLLRARA